MSSGGHRSKIAIIAAAEITVTSFLRNHIVELCKNYEVTVITNTDNPHFLQRLGISAEVVSVNLERKISPVRDVLCLIRLINILRENKFDLIFSVTPKAGLLGMLAGLVARIPSRVHMFTGQVWVTKRGLLRRLLKSIDRVIALSATSVLVDSFSQNEFILNEGVVRPGRSSVLANGSICGVDTKRFSPDEVAKSEIRASLKLPSDASMLLFLGRLNLDKGVLDLAHAFASLKIAECNVYLVFVGPDEGGLAAQIKEICADVISNVRFAGTTDFPERYMAAADVFCLPSYREGFGSVLIEAAAVGVPAVASRIYGITDAVSDGKTGLLHTPGDVDSISESLLRLVEGPELVQQMGKQARERVLEEFSSERVTSAFVDYLGSTLK